MNLKPFPHFQQQESADCGPACLRMVAKYVSAVKVSGDDDVRM